MKTLLLATAALLAVPVVAAQTPAPTRAPAPAPKPMDPVGNYGFQVMLPDGDAIGGQFMIKGAKDAWEGTITSDAAPEAPLTGVKVEGQVLMFNITGPDGSGIPLRLTFTGDDFSGQLDFGGTILMIAGKRIKPAP